MPTRFIASRSAVIPSRVMLLFSQNQYTQGRAESGGLTKLFAKSSAPRAAPARRQSPKRTVANRFFMMCLPSS